MIIGRCSLRLSWLGMKGLETETFWFKLKWTETKYFLFIITKNPPPQCKHVYMCMYVVSGRGVLSCFSCKSDNFPWKKPWFVRNYLFHWKIVLMDSSYVNSTLLEALITKYYSLKLYKWGMWGKYTYSYVFNSKHYVITLSVYTML